MSYMIIGLVFGGLSMLVSSRLKSKFKKYSEVHLKNGMSGKEIAEKMLSDHGIRDVEVISVPGQLTDHYNPLKKTVNLSSVVYGQRNASAAAVAAHEVGHAMQDHQNDPRLVIRTKLVPIADKVARFSAGAIWAAPIFALLTRHPVPFWVLAACGLGGLLIRMMVHLVTLPIEWDASFGKALPVLQAGSYLGAKQEQVVAKILRAAAFTYVAAALADVLNLTRWAALLLRR